MIDVIVVEDHPITRSGMTYLIRETPGLRLVETVADGSSVPGAVTQHAPDVVILDMVLPGGSGLYVLEELARLETPCRVLVYSGQSSASDFAEARDKGAAGLVSKSEPPETLLEAIFAIGRGDAFISERVASLLATLPSPRKAGISLTPREQEILVLVARGQSSREISEQLHIASATVKKHRANLMAKLGLRSAAEATRYAINAGLISVTR